MRSLSNHGGKRSGVGRPSGSRGEDTRTAVVKFRVHPKEKAELQRRAAKRNMTVSEYMLHCSLSGRDDDIN